MHHHMTFHGGTTLVGIFHHRTCALSPNTCAAQGAIGPTIGAWLAAKDLPMTERRQRVEAALLGISALAAYDGEPHAGMRGWCGRPANLPKDWKASMDGSDPVELLCGNQNFASSATPSTRGRGAGPAPRRPDAIRASAGTASGPSWRR